MVTTTPSTAAALIVDRAAYDRWQAELLRSVLEGMGNGTKAELGELLAMQYPKERGAAFAELQTRGLAPDHESADAFERIYGAAVGRREWTADQIDRYAETLATLGRLSS